LGNKAPLTIVGVTLETRPEKKNRSKAPRICMSWAALPHDYDGKRALPGKREMLQCAERKQRRARQFEKRASSL